MSSTPASSSHSIARQGLFAAIGAFLIWGLLPLYLRPLQQVPALQLVANRVLFGCASVLGWLALRGELAHVAAALRTPDVRNKLIASALLVSINWLVYVWAATHGHVIDGSLGYFINPLVNVVLGVVVLGERLNRVQTMAVVLAASGVAYLTWQAGRPPYIALVLALSFGAYGLVRKVVAVDSLVGLAAETLVVAPIAGAYLAWCELDGSAALGHRGAAVSSLLVLGGPLTALPLALFAFAARRIRYATVGIVQYIGPSLQLLLGIVLYHEPFPASRALGFGLIWLALVVYAGDSLVRANARA